MIHFHALGKFILLEPLAILLCIIVYMVIGSLWYGPLFSKPWLKMVGIQKTMSKKDMQKAMVPALLTSVATGFVLTVVLGRGMQILSMGHWSYPLIVATILWFPFTFMVMAQNYAYTNKPFKLLLIDSGYILVALWAMAMILWYMV